MVPYFVLFGSGAVLLIAAVLVLPGRLRSVESGYSRFVWPSWNGRRLSPSEVKVWWALVLVLPSAALMGFAFVHGSFYFEHETEARARQAILAMVARSPGVRVNGESIDDPTILLEALRSIADVPAHHSAPTTPFRLELSSGSEVMGLEIALDCYRPAEFWVFRPGPNWHQNPRGEYAGRVTSPELSAYLSHHVP